jgi:hypothetical protein
MFVLENRSPKPAPGHMVPRARELALSGGMLALWLVAHAAALLPSPIAPGACGGRGGARSRASAGVHATQLLGECDGSGTVCLCLRA